tara:strand:- start:119 stop:640 length:522 start_codon:yes stop_codon:yes gene_type:complete
MNLPLKKINNEVFIATDEIVHLSNEAITFIKERALESSRGRSRICLHKEDTDNLHEMLIAISKESYIRPHRHKNKSESFHLIDGEADVVIFSEEGEIKQVINLSSSTNFFYRLDTPNYHTLLIHSPLLVIHEITNGPFDALESDFASFSPEEESEEVKFYLSNLRKVTEDFHI